MTLPTPPHPVLDKYYPTDADRQPFVAALFDGAARHYDHIGRMLDLGSGPWYRRWTLRRAGLRPGMRVLDVATGTGLMARGAVRIVGAANRVIGIDPSRGMLREARKTLAGPLLQGRAEALPFHADVFDMLSMGFALRHVPDLEQTFREYRRVLKPGGKLVLLEVSRPARRVSRALIRVHFQRILPLLARISTKSAPAELLMRYYWDTIDQCVPPATILEVLRRARFANVERRGFFGFLNEFVATKPAD